MYNNKIYLLKILTKIVGENETVNVYEAFEDSSSANTRIKELKNNSDVLEVQWEMIPFSYGYVMTMRESK